MTSCSTVAAVLLAVFIITACGSSPRRQAEVIVPSPLVVPSPPVLTPAARPDSGRGQEIALFSLGLLDAGYRFGGKNPEAGLDCSGMASYVLEKSAGIALGGSAASIAKQGRKIALDDSRAGDLVFFNTRGGPYTHVGIYMGDGRFIHAPSSTQGKVRLDTLRDGYFAQRFTEARAYID